MKMNSTIEVYRDCAFDNDLVDALYGDIIDLEHFKDSEMASITFRVCTL